MKSAEARFALRCLLFGLGAAVTTLTVDGFDAWPKAILAAASAALAYAGIGAAVPQVEPNVGAKMDSGEGLAR